MKLINMIRWFRRNESGASMVEYGVALLVVTAIGVGLMGSIGQGVGQLVTAACNTIATAPGTTNAC